MKGTRKLTIVLAIAVSLRVGVDPQPVNAQANPTVNASRSITSYAGRWDLTIRTPTREQPAWILVSEDKGRLEGLMVGLWGHATPTGEIQIKDGAIEFSMPKGEGFPEGTLFNGRIAGGEGGQAGG